MLPDILTGSTSLWGEHSSVITPENAAKGMNILTIGVASLFDISGKLTRVRPSVSLSDKKQLLSISTIDTHPE